MAMDNCSHECINTVGSFQCSCRSGFTLNTDNKTCNGISLVSYLIHTMYSTDIDECSIYSGTCDHTCTNTIGTYICSCDSGYIIHDNGHNCTGNLH